MLTGAGLVIGGIGLIILSILTWRAWRLGKPGPLHFLGQVDESRTEMKTIALGFEVFSEVLIGIVLIAVGANILSQ